MVKKDALLKRAKHKKKVPKEVSKSSEGLTEKYYLFLKWSFLILNVISALRLFSERTFPERHYSELAVFPTRA